MKSQEIFIFVHHRNAQDKSNQIGVQESPTDTEIGSDFTPTLNASTSNRNYKICFRRSGTPYVIVTQL